MCNFNLHARFGVKLLGKSDFDEIKYKIMLICTISVYFIDAQKGCERRCKGQRQNVDI